MNKFNLQDIELSVFEKIKSKMDFPLWLKISGGVLILLILLTLSSLLLLKNSSRLGNVTKKISPTPTVVEQKTVVSNERKQWQTIKTQLDDHDPLQKELLPPEIDLEIKFEQ